MLRSLSRAISLVPLSRAFTFQTKKITRKWPLLIATSFTSYFLFQSINLIEDNELKNARKQLDNERKRLQAQFGQMTICPQIKYDIKGRAYTIEFEIDQRKCNIFFLITQFQSLYNSVKNFKILDFKVFSQGNVLTWYIDFQEQDPKWKTPQKGRLTITGIKTNERPNFRLIFQKDDCITENNIQALKLSYREAIKPKQTNYNENQFESKPRKSVPQPTKKQTDKSFEQLEKLGVTIFDPDNKAINLDWDYLAGYENQKRSIEDTVLLALSYPQIYDEITKQTRVKYQVNRPKAVLFEGPPGTGKTTSAKIIAQQVNIPLIYIPIEAVLSKFYGESEQRLSGIWQACKKLGKVIIFIDQIDALAGSRESDLHEASKRILSTLLRKIDSFQSTVDVLLICATNRKQDLDAAMLSRIDLSINFSLPDKQSRAAIFSRYAKHLSNEQRLRLAQQTNGFSGRNISDVCKDAERRWASKLIRKQVEERLPNLKEYVEATLNRKINELR